VFGVGRATRCDLAAAVRGRPQAAPRILALSRPSGSRGSGWQGNFARRLALSMLRGRRGGPGVRKLLRLAAPADLGSPAPSGRWAPRAPGEASRGCWPGASWPRRWRWGPGAGSPQAPDTPSACPSPPNSLQPSELDQAWRPLLDIAGRGPSGAHR
jgi:hypothetical protein